VTGRKSDLEGLTETDAPVSNAIGSVGARAKFGWRVGTESEVVTDGAEATVVVATGVAEAKVSIVGSAPIKETNR